MSYPTNRAPITISCSYFTSLHSNILKPPTYSFYRGIVILSLFFPTITIPYSYCDFRQHILLTSAFILFFSNETQLNQTLEGVTKKVNLNADDLRVSVGMSCSLWALSHYITHVPIRLFLQSTSILLPACSALLSNKMLKRMQTIPLIKQYITASEFCSHLPIMDILFECTNKDCDSICNECKLRRGYQMLPVLAFAVAGTLSAKAYYTHHYKPLAAEFNILISNKEKCSICLEEYTQHCLPLELHEDKESHVKHYVCTQCYSEAFIKHRIPNNIRVTTEIDGITYESYERDPIPCSHCRRQCPLCKQFLDERKIIAERLDCATRYQKRAATN